MRTVFVLGAGFSTPAGLPTQADIMRRIVHRASQDNVRGTMSGLFNVIEKEQMEAVPLEDIFTMLDRARNARETFVGFSPQQLEDSYRLLTGAIAAELERLLADFDEGPYRDFAAGLVAKRIGDGSDAARASSPFTLLTLNWDTVVEHLVARHGREAGVAVDYGCTDIPLDRGALDSEVRSAREVPLLKLHGSVNWLVCSSCDRLYSVRADGRTPPVAQPYRRPCAHCRTTLLEGLMVTPTLVKKLDQPHLSLVWHRALLALQAATRIVFIGYSFPVADFELRYLLLRALTGRRDVSIRVVLYPPDGASAAPRDLWQREVVEQRYRNFFGARDLEVRAMDVRELLAKPVLLWYW